MARTITKACGPIPVTDSLTIDGSLTLEAGVVLKFAPDAELIIEVAWGQLHATTTWLTQPNAIVQVVNDVSVDGNFTLTVKPGTYQWKADTSLTVGYRANGTLKIVGRADAPVVFTALPGGEPWKGIVLDESARSVELAYLNLADTAGDAGVIGKAGAVGKLDHVSCVRCAATVAPACKAKLELGGAVTAGTGTKLAIKKPTGC